MQLSQDEEIIKMQPKGVMTVPKKFRTELGMSDNILLRLKKEKGRLVVEVVRALPYPVRTYTNKEIDEFIEFDKSETKKAKKKDLI